MKIINNIHNNNYNLIKIIERNDSIHNHIKNQWVLSLKKNDFFIYVYLYRLKFIYFNNQIFMIIIMKFLSALYLIEIRYNYIN